jgi:CRISPR-associated protein Cas5d
MASFCLEVSGPFACFTRPEMKVERVSYDVMTPSSARSIFEAILWKPAIRWRVHRIEVLKPIRWINLRRNEVSAVVSTRNVQQAMTAGSGTLGLYIEEERQQRAGYFLRDVAYRIHADLSLVPGRPPEPLAKYTEMFTRRARKGLGRAHGGGQQHQLHSGRQQDERLLPRVPALGVVPLAGL